MSFVENTLPKTDRIKYKPYQPEFAGKIGKRNSWSGVRSPFLGFERGLSFGARREENEPE